MIDGNVYKVTLNAKLTEEIVADTPEEAGKRAEDIVSGKLDEILANADVNWALSELVREIDD